MWTRWVFTVATVTAIADAISRFVRPSASNTSTSRSRGESIGSSPRRAAGRIAPPSAPSSPGATYGTPFDRVLERGTSSSTPGTAQDDASDAEGDEIADEVVGRRRHQGDDRGPGRSAAQTGGRHRPSGQIGRGSEHDEAAAVHRHDPDRVSCGVRLGRDLDAVTAHGGD